MGQWRQHICVLARDLIRLPPDQLFRSPESRAATTLHELGLPTELEQHASYIGGWLEALKNDKRELFRAAAATQSITDWVLALPP